MEREKIGFPYLNGEAKKILNINTRRINFHLKSKVQLGSHHPSERTKIDLILFLLLLWDLFRAKTAIHSFYTESFKVSDTL